MLMCGRRWGKTKYGVRRTCDVVVSGGKVGWFAPGYKYASEAWRELVKRLGPVVVGKNEQERRLEIRGGGVVEVWTLDTEDPARGRDYDLVVIDEAGIVRGLLKAWQEAIRPTLTDRRGKALFLGTPKGMSGEFSQLFQKAEQESPLWYARRAETLENPFIPEDEIEQARRDLPPAVFDQEYRGIPADDGGNPFGLRAIVEAAEEPKFGKTVVVYGLDLARATDFCVLLGLNAHMETVHLERWQAPWATSRVKIKEMVKDVPVVGDATGVGDGIVADLQEMGVLVEGFKFSLTSKLALMQRLVTAFQRRELKIGTERWLRTELESFGFEYTASGVRYSSPPGMHDDGVMALALAVRGWDHVQGAKPVPIVMDGRRKPDDPWMFGQHPAQASLSPVSGLPSNF